MPAEVRKTLGVGPGSILEWDRRDGEVVVRRAGRYSSADIHFALFKGSAPAPKSTDELKESIRKYMRTKHARR